jgi:hypothetical protein
MTFSFLERGLMGSMKETSVRSDVGTVRERVGLLVVPRGTANSVHQFAEPVVKASIEFDTVRTSAIITRQLIKLAL